MSGPSPGWYEDPETGARRYWDGWKWDSPPPPPMPVDASRRWLVLTPIVLVIGLACVLAFNHWRDSRPVSKIHSSTVQVEAFYRELDRQGLGDMPIGDVHDLARARCNRDDWDVWVGLSEHIKTGDDFSRFLDPADKVCDYVEDF